MAAYVRGDHPVLGSEGRYLVVPDAVVDVPRVEEDDEITGAGVEVGEVTVGGGEETNVRSTIHDNQGVIFGEI
ncbi:hypothetical protein GCM10010276_30040 [Streptomyces longisporus]|uniref:Uncharacterized protein n=1 Tax=Streptomyces longisporus TaxID=1948 RepID=A0ABP5YYD6_STRLO